MNDMNKISIYNKVAAATNSSPKLGEQLKRMAAFIFALSAFTLITSCTEDDLVTQTTPLAPQGMKTVTVDFQLPEGKPAFGEGETRATTTDGTWANGDELMMKVTVKGYDDTDGYAVYESYMTLAYDQSDGYWDMLEDKNTTVTENSPVANPDYVMLAQTTDIDLTQPLSIKVPEDMSLDMTIVSVTYAPELEWDITPDANGAVTDVNRKLKATATTTAPECWEVSSGAWTINQARLRVHTGAAGDVVTITSEKFYPNSIGKSADGIYTATTDSEGNAYFYGEAGSYDDSDRITATTSGFNLSLTAVTVGDGDAAFTCHIPPVTLLEASTDVSVKLVEGKSYRLEATEKRTAVTSTIAVIDGASSSDDITTAIKAGKTTLYVTGEEVDYIMFAISDSEAADGSINLILADATAIGEYAFASCTALKSVSAPKATSIGDYAFMSCSALASVSLPAAETRGGGAFLNCAALESVSLPAAKTIGNNAFDACSALASVSLPAAETIGVGAFAGCTSLASVSAPKATTIGGGAFFDCKPLTSVSLPAAITIGEQAFMQCDALKSLTFGEVIETVGTDAFYSVPTTTCTLTLNSGQLSSTDLAPSGNTWAGKT